MLDQELMQMRCEWQAFLNLLPLWMRQEVDKLGRDALQELRLRLHAPPELITLYGSKWLTRKLTQDDLVFCVNTASKYSPWAASTAARGYITASGGHRVGLCGDAVVSAGEMMGIRSVTSLCLRVARDFPGIAGKAAPIHGSILILGKPGSGKTTLLRDLIRYRSERENVSVVDEKGELFPLSQNRFCFSLGKKTDILIGCGKPRGIETILRNMGPETIAVDEITAEEDCQALLQAGWCGVELLATAHAASREDLLSRPVYRPLAQSGLFQTLIILRADKSWTLERMNL